MPTNAPPNPQTITPECPPAPQYSTPKKSPLSLSKSLINESIELDYDSHSFSEKPQASIESFPFSSPNNPTADQKNAGRLTKISEVDESDLGCKMSEHTRAAEAMTYFSKVEFAQVFNNLRKIPVAFQTCGLEYGTHYVMTIGFELTKSAKNCDKIAEKLNDLKNDISQLVALDDEYEKRGDCNQKPANFNQASMDDEFRKLRALFEESPLIDHLTFRRLQNEKKLEPVAKGCEVVVSGKIRGQRAKAMKFMDGMMIHSGNPVREYVDTAVRHVQLRQGMLGIKVKILKPHDPEGLNGPKTLYPDIIQIAEPKEDRRPAEDKSKQV